MKFPHSFAVIQRVLTLAQLAVCQRGQCIKVHLNSHDVRIQLYICLIQMTGLLPLELLVLCDTVRIAIVIIIVTIVIIRINCILQSPFSGNFAQTPDILPFPVFHSERAPCVMECFLLFVQTSHARYGHVAGSILIRLQCFHVYQAKSSLLQIMVVYMGKLYIKICGKFLRWKWELVFTSWPEGPGVFH